ncbi:methionine--tRNA ligase [bacterium AH-315-J21]|nr:methionine--tRNA ligase [bacterium AH-315-J21]
MPNRPIYITTPIYYVNDRPHIGHSYTTVAADTLARFHRLAGREAFFLTGSDEHGAKISEAAEAAGMEPQAFCDSIVVHFKDTWKALGIEENDFIRTTDPRHLEAVTKILTKLKAAKAPDGEDVIYASQYEGLYCIGCEKYLTEKELEDGVCPYHKTKPKLVSENNWFFRLSAYLPEIKRLVESEELLILPIERRKEVLGLIEQCPPDFSISREKVSWGIPVPFDKKQSAYVWVDALSNYISAIGYGADEQLFQKWWRDAETVHLMAKDILKFHCLFWPAMLLAIGEKLPEKIFLHGFFTVDGQKMSKTLGNQIDPNELVSHFGTDASRYLLLTQYPFGVDGDIQVARFTEKYNSDLANELGNLLSRVVKMIERQFDGKLPGPHKDLAGTQELLELAEDAADRAYGEIKHFRIQGAIEVAQALIKKANQFFDHSAPWKAIKEDRFAEAGGVLYLCCEVLRVVSVLLYPVLPSKMIELRAVLGEGSETLKLDSAREFFCLKPGSPVTLTEPLFPRIQEAFEPSGMKKAEAKKVSADGLIDISDFGKVKLKVAEILSAEKVEGADKLLKLQISLGKEKRQIVAGVAEFYSAEELVGKQIIVVTNLKPAKIRGIESQGMLLAAKKGKKLTLVSPSGEIPVGASVG